MPAAALEAQKEKAYHPCTLQQRSEDSITPNNAHLILYNVGEASPIIHVDNYYSW